MVDDAIDEGDGRGRVGEDGGPVAKREVVVRIRLFFRVGG
jgi:hypothetical protein